MISSKDIWQSFSSFFSAVTVRDFLNQSYTKLKVIENEKRSYENCYPFIYYIEHGKNYYQLASQAPLSIQPVLLFYGMVQLLKACLLTVDPQYPETTSVLAHGVSTRKRKKQSYEFLFDEVKIQKNGLFSCFSDKMFHMKHLEGEKFSMISLLKEVPELYDLFEMTNSKLNICTVAHKSDQHLTFPKDILDVLHMTYNRFTEHINHTIPYKLHNDKQYQNQDTITFTMDDSESLHPLTCMPLKYHMTNETYYFLINREQPNNLSEIMVHYLLLYNLSMICRYETEWWNELLHSYASNDFPFIQRFLSITTTKAPFLLLQFLLKNTYK
ncbi:YaaC family protein [Cytobacillus sp. Hm23]